MDQRSAPTTDQTTCRSRDSTSLHQKDVCTPRRIPSKIAKKSFTPFDVVTDKTLSEDTRDKPSVERNKKDRTIGSKDRADDKQARKIDTSVFIERDSVAMKTPVRRKSSFLSEETTMSHSRTPLTIGSDPYIGGSTPVGVKLLESKTPRTTAARKGTSTAGRGAGMGETQEPSTEQRTSDDRPRKLEIKSNTKSFDFFAFLDSHYRFMGPGVRKKNYTIDEYMVVLKTSMDVLGQDPTMVDLKPPLTIVGDIHGQFNDLINMFVLLGRPPEKNYLFLGDYVDRGFMSTECIMLLLTYKICYPNSVTLLRGNHECARINDKYGFREECRQNVPDNFGEEIWAQFQRVFDMLPIAALVATKMFCMHGGLSPTLRSLDELRQMKRPLRNPIGVANDMMWSDPDEKLNGWRNGARGSGFMFGKDAVKHTCERFGLDCIVRAHQVCPDGYWISADMKVITLFSAPMYCNQIRNVGCVLNVSEDLSCKFVAMVPESNGCHNRVKHDQLLWSEEIDNILCGPQR